MFPAPQPVTREGLVALGFQIRLVGGTTRASEMFVLDNGSNAIRLYELDSGTWPMRIDDGFETIQVPNARDINAVARLVAALRELEEPHP